MKKRKAPGWRLAFIAGLASLSLTLCPVTGAAEPALTSTLEPTAGGGYYLDSRGTPVAFEPMYEAWFGSGRYEPKPLRLILENAALLGLEVGIYWYDKESSVVDWQFPSLGTKLTSSESYRFDDNRLLTNYLFHPFAGMTHYVVTRSNGFGVLGGFAAAAGSSAIYEFLLEWKELVSLNDLVVTPFGGTAMGEFFHHLGNYLNSEPRAGRRHAVVGEALHQGVSKTLGLPRSLHDAIDGPSPFPATPRDNLGLSSAYWHRFRVLAAQQTIADAQGLVARLLGVDASFELAAMPGFLRPGKFERAFYNGNFTSFDARVLLAAERHDVEVAFDSHLFGHYSQDFEVTAAGRRGYANELAVGVGLVYRSQSWRGRSDQYGVLHLLRPTERGWVALGPATLRFSGDLALDMASVHGLAYETYVARYGSGGTKSSLQRHGYVHAWGLSAGGSAALEMGAFELGARGRFGRYESIEGLERYEEEVTRDAHGTETIARIAAHLRAEPRRSVFSGKLELARDSRSSSLGTISEKRANLRLTSALGMRF